MDALILALAVVGLAAYVALPLYRVPTAPRRDDTNALCARRDALFAHLRELRWDHEAGLVSDEEYGRQRAVVEREAASVLRAIDTASPPPGD